MTSGNKFVASKTIIDIRMPRMDGLEAIGHIIELNKDTAIIINTACSAYKTNDFMSLAADAYVEKTSDLSGLKKTVKNVLAKKKSASAATRESKHDGM